MDLHNKKIGIWGFGVVGQSAARFMINYSRQIQIMDKKAPTAEQEQWLTDHAISFVAQSSETINFFLEYNDYILCSPGITITPYYAPYFHKWICELDIFASHFNKPIIAITGSVGKTSITTLLGGILKKLGGATMGNSPVIGGNIGTCSLDFITPPAAQPIENMSTCSPTSSRPLTHTHNQTFIDSPASTDDQTSYLQATSALLEVSSFQIAYTKHFAPHLAIITNFSPNHLDWHGDLDHYLHAKLNIYTYQTATDYALVPYELRDAYTAYQQRKPHMANTFLFSTHTISLNELSSLEASITLYYLQNNVVMRYQNQMHTQVYALNQLPPITCTQNWLIIIATLAILDLPLTHIHEFVTTLTLPPHRLERVITPPHYPMAIYNDSKSTTPAATLNALQTLAGKPTHLFLGGLSKGIDREPLIAELQHKVKKIYCFGAEHAHLAQLCAKYQISYEMFATLEPAVHTCLISALPDEQIIFSPAGSSYDLFQHYEHRGDQFKQMVARFLQNLA